MHKGWRPPHPFEDALDWRTGAVRRILLAILVTVLLSSVADSTTASGGRAATRTVVTTAFSKTLKNTIVVDKNGRTLYMLTLDRRGTPTCASIDPGCPKIWPAFTSAGKPLARKGIKASLLGITKGAGGVRQVTYNGHPLYRYENDLSPGDVNGQACYGEWYVLSTQGNPIRKRGPQC